MSREKDKFSLQAANRLTQERLRLFQSQEEAGGAVGVSRVMWGQYERAEASPGGAVLEKLAAAGADVQYILTGQHGTPAMTAEQERAGYVVQVLSPAEAAALDALRGSGALANNQSAVITGDKNSVNQSQGGAHGKPGRKARSPDRG